MCGAGKSSGQGLTDEVRVNLQMRMPCPVGWKEGQKVRNLGGDDDK